MLLGNARVEREAEVYHAILDEGAVVGEGARIGAPREDGDRPELTLVGMSVVVKGGSRVEAGASLAPAED